MDEFQRYSDNRRRQREYDDIDYNRQPKKRKRKANYTLLYIAVVFLAIIVLAVLSFTIFFPIKSVEVKGSSRYSVKEITEAADIKMGGNLFSTDLSDVEEDIVSQLSYISKVKIERKFPSTIVLTIEKAVPFAQIENGSEYGIIEANGKCLEVKKSPSKNIPIVRGSKVNALKNGKKVEFSDSNENADVMRLISDVIISANNNKLNMTVVNVSDTTNIWSTFDNKIVLQFGSGNYFDEKFAYAVSTIELRKNNGEQGILNLSRIPNNKNQVGFLPQKLNDEQIAKYSK